MDTLFSLIDNFNKGNIEIKSGTLKFWGDWFGRPMDNFHSIKKLKYDDIEDLLLVNFDQEESLKIWMPKGIIIGRNEFVIKSADKLRWEWYSYGLSGFPRSQHFIEYIFKGNKIEVISGCIGMGNSLKKYLYSLDEVAVEIC